MSTRTLDQKLAEIDAAIEVLEEKRTRLIHNVLGSRRRKESISNVIVLPPPRNAITVEDSHWETWPPQLQLYNDVSEVFIGNDGNLSTILPEG